MVPASSHEIPRVSWYSGYCLLLSPFVYRAFTFSGRLFQNCSTVLHDGLCSPNPAVHAPRFGLFRFRSPLLPESFFIFSSSGYLDVSVHRVPFLTLWIHVWMTEVPSAGFPHSEIRGSLPICGSPRLIAAYHVFRRPLVPRHPPCALFASPSSSRRNGGPSFDFHA